MTIALGIQATDGIVVAADTEESGGYLKSETTKILHVLGEVQLGTTPPVRKGGACVISGAGDSGHVSALMTELAETFLNDKSMVGKNLEKAFEACVSGFHSDHIIPFSSFPSHERPSIEMLIAYNRDHQHGLFISEKSVLLRKAPYAAVGCGSIFAEILLNRLWRNSSAKMARILAAYVVFRVKESIEGCGKFTQVSTLHASKIVPSQEHGSILVAADQPITYMLWTELDELEREFRTSWARREQENLWKLIGELGGG